MIVDSSDMAAMGAMASLVVATYYEPDAAPVTVAAAAGIGSAIVVPLVIPGLVLDEDKRRQRERRALAGGLLVGVLAGFWYRSRRRA